MDSLVSPMESPLTLMKGNLSIRDKRAVPANRCRVCKDQGWVFNPAKRKVEDCDCKREQIHREAVEASGIYEVIRGKSFENFRVPEKNTALYRGKLLGMDYVEKFDSKKGTNPSLAFLGTVGSGKTHLSCAIVGELLKQDVDVAYFPYREEITYLKQCIMKEEIYQKRMNTYKNANVLLLDDLFKGKVSESEINIIFELINHRYSQNKAMIISSEFTVSQLVAINEAVGSRILEMTRGRVVQFQGAKLNYRLYR